MDGVSAARAADSWNLWRSDLAALQLLGANAYRLGIEWSRLEPAPGAWDETAAARYREMFAGLRAAGITPIVTLYHFTLPTVSTTNRSSTPSRWAACASFSPA